jgi:hypothetical protein
MHGGPCSSREVNGKLWCFPCGDPTVAKESNPTVAKLAANWQSQSQSELLDSPTDDGESDESTICCCKVHYVTKQNNKQVLLTMCLGLVKEEPYTSAQQKQLFLPTVPSMLKEIQQCCTFLDLAKQPKPNNWKKPAMIA